jgi:hypothetical protein
MEFTYDDSGRMVRVVDLPTMRTNMTYDAGPIADEPSLVTPPLASPPADCPAAGDPTTQKAPPCSPD